MTDRFLASWRRRARAALALAGSLAAAGALAAAPGDVRDTSFTLPDGERVLELAIDVPASARDAWNAFATTDGFRAWAAPVTRVDMRVGGEVETSYDPAAAIGAPTNIRNAILALVPERMFLMRNVQAPPKTPFDAPTFQKLVTVIVFTPLTPTTTRVTVQNPGFRDGPAYDGVYKFFQAGNAWTLMQLKERFETGPVDWAKKLAPAAAAPK